MMYFVGTVNIDRCTESPPPPLLTPPPRPLLPPSPPLPPALQRERFLIGRLDGTSGSRADALTDASLENGQMARRPTYRGASAEWKREREGQWVHSRAPPPPTPLHPSIPPRHTIAGPPVEVHNDPAFISIGKV